MICDVSSCDARAVVVVRFSAAPDRPYPYCARHSRPRWARDRARQEWPWRLAVVHSIEHLDRD